jgi:hypothetical protein
MESGVRLDALTYSSVQKRKSLKEARKSKKAARAGEKPFQVDSSVRDALEGNQLTPNQVFEGQAILGLGLLFSVCLFEGLIVAASVCHNYFNCSLEQLLQSRCARTEHFQRFAQQRAVLRYTFRSVLF